VQETAEAAELTSEQKADCLKRCKATIVEFLNIKVRKSLSFIS
jgi:hypothetical protein